MNKHPGFKAVANKIKAHAEEKGMSKEKAEKYAYGGLANRSRNASAKARKATPRLKRVKG